MRFPKLIKEEYYSTSPIADGVWIQKLSFRINKRLREELLKSNSLRKAYDSYQTYLNTQSQMKIFYTYFVNLKKPLHQKKSRREIDNEFLEIEKNFIEYSLSACKALYILDVPKGIKKIKTRVERRKKELLKIFRRLPVEICFKIFKYTFTY